MSLKLGSMIRATSLSQGVGDIVIADAPGFRTIGTDIGHGNRTWLQIRDPDAGVWEIGEYEIEVGGNVTIKRPNDSVVILSSSGSTRVSFGVGLKEIHVDLPGEKAFLLPWNVRARSVSVDQNLGDDDAGVLIDSDATSAPIVHVLPAYSSARAASVFAVRKKDGSANAVSLTTSDSTIDGASTVTLPGRYDVVVVAKGATEWQVIGRKAVALSAFAALTPAANKGVYFTSGTAAALFDLTAFGRSIGGLADAAAARALFGAVNIAGDALTGYLTLHADPSSAMHAATKAYVDSVAAGFDVKASVKCATTGNITLSGEQTIDGVTTSASRVLVKAQSAAAENGLYTSAAGAWARVADMDAWTEVPGAFVFVEEGSTLADTGWVCTAGAGGTIGSTAITWAQFSGVGAYQAISAILTAIAGLSPSAGQAFYFTSASAVATYATTSFGRGLVGLAGAINLWDSAGANGADIATSATVDLDAATGDMVDLTGNTTVTAITLAAGRTRRTRTTGTPQFTHGSSLVLITAGNIVAAAGDIQTWRGYAGGVVRMIGYERASGSPLVSATGSIWNSLPEDVRTGDFTVTSAQNGRCQVADKATPLTFTLPAAASNADMVLPLANIGAGNLILDGNASETIEGLLTRTMYTGDRCVLWCNGTTWKCIANSQGGHNRQIFSASGTFDPNDLPPWVNYITVHVWAAGGGGGATSGTNSYGAGGAGGGYARERLSVLALSESGETVTVGAGGAARSANSGSDGGNGGTSSFGSFLSAGGGPGGATSGTSVGGGTGSGGDVNLQGGIGFSFQALAGGGQYQGHGGFGAGGGAAGGAHTIAGGTPGGGGGGGNQSFGSGAGGGGMVIVEW